MTRKRSLLFSIDRNIIQDLLNKNSSIRGVLRDLGFNDSSGNHVTLKQRIKQDNLCLNMFNLNKKMNYSKVNLTSTKSIEEIFCLNSTYQSSMCMKKKLIDNNLKNYECSKCGNLGFHNGEILKLQLDHENGIRTDNRLENLRFLCPNCHSQTSTFAGKKHKINRKCASCSCPIHRASKKCIPCELKERRRSPNGTDFLHWPSVDEVITMCKSNSFVSVGRILDRSDNSIRKFLKRNGINPKTFEKNGSSG